MEWKLFADLAQVAGSRSVTVDREPGETVGDALEALFEVHPELRERVLEDGDVVADVNLLHNGVDVHDEAAGLETEVEGDDELALFPPVSGG